jgi:hypothetical protein
LVAVGGIKDGQTPHPERGVDEIGSPGIVRAAMNHRFAHAIHRSGANLRPGVRVN